MMQETNDEENPAPVPAPDATEGGEASEPTDLVEDVIDKVCDPCGLVNIDCCGRAPSTDIPDKDFPAEKLPDDDAVDEENPAEPNSGESASVANNSQQTQTIADIAAKLDEIDLETVAEETNSLQKEVNSEWYKEPLYASLIVLCGVFSFIILVLAILLIKN